MTFVTTTQQNGCQCKLMALVKAVHNRDHIGESCAALAHGTQRDLCISNRTYVPCRRSVIQPSVP